jgi:adenylosuccinate lyase
MPCLPEALPADAGALPITFGHKCAIWLSETGRNYEGLKQLEPSSAASGAVGTKASLGDRAFELDEKVMARLGLAVADADGSMKVEGLGEAAISAL